MDVKFINVQYIYNKSLRIYNEEYLGQMIRISYVQEISHFHIKFSLSLSVLKNFLFI